MTQVLCLSKVREEQNGGLGMNLVLHILDLRY